MSLPKQLIVKESLGALRQLQKKSIPMIATRIKALIEFKKHESTGISKRAVADAVGVNHNSVQAWRKLYETGGINTLLSYEKQTGRPSGISEQEHTKLAAKLKDPKNGLRGYVELLNWMEKEFNKTFKYNTILKYAYRHFQTAIKVARKSHIKKDDEAVDTFKKTSVKNVKHYPKITNKSIKQ